MTIPEYIDNQALTYKPHLNEVYKTIKEAIPDAEERISMCMPTFGNEKDIICFDKARTYIKLLPGKEAIKAFSKQLTEYKIYKDTIQFPYDKELPLDLIAEIAKWCYENNSK